MNSLASKPTAVLSGRNRFSMQKILDRPKATNVPLRIIVHGGGGIGKTSFAAQFREPIFVQSRGESGLQTLESAGIVSAAIMPFSHNVKQDDGTIKEETFYEAQNFRDVLDAVDFLTNVEHSYKTLVFDVMNGIEKLIHEYTCWKDFDNNWGNEGFASYGKGFDQSVIYLKDLTNKIDTMRTKRGMTTVMLAHSTVKTYKNPTGADYDRFVPDMHQKMWGWLYGWADIVLFANRVVEVKPLDKSGKKGKPGEDLERIIYTEQGPSFDAKNRHNLPYEISMGNSAKEAFANFTAAVRDSIAAAKSQQ